MAAEIQRALSKIVANLKDPRVPGMTSILRVELARDLSHAKIYVSVLGGEKKQNDALKGLNSAVGFMQRELGKMIQIRTLPQLHFLLDDSIEYGIHMNQLFDRLKENQEEQDKL